MHNAIIQDIIKQYNIQVASPIGSYLLRIITLGGGYLPQALSHLICKSGSLGKVWYIMLSIDPALQFGTQHLCPVLGFFFAGESFEKIKISNYVLITKVY